MGQLLVPQDLRKRHPHPVRLLVIENMPGAGLLRNRSFVQSRLTISRSFRNSNPSALAGSKAPNSTLEQDT